MIEILFSLLILVATTAQPSEHCAHCLDKGSIQNLIGYDRAIHELCWYLCESLPDYPDEVSMEYKKGLRMNRNELEIQRKVTNLSLDVRYICGDSLIDKISDEDFKYFANLVYQTQDYTLTTGPTQELGYMFRGFVAGLKRSNNEPEKNAASRT